MTMTVLGGFLISLGALSMGNARGRGKPYRTEYWVGVVISWAGWFVLL